MSSYSQAKNAYSVTSRTTTSDPKTVEYQAFAQITSRLVRANENRTENFSEYVSALYDNTNLWKTLAYDLLDEENQLEQDLKVQLLNLANYSHQHAHKALKSDIGADALISINNMIMRGLRGDTGAEEATIRSLSEEVQGPSADPEIPRFTSVKGV